MRKKFTFSAGLILALIGTSIASQAQLLINENFTGYSAGNLNGQGGWVSSGDGNNINVVVKTNNDGALVKAGYTSGTNYISIDNSGKDYRKRFLGNTNVGLSNNTTLWLTFVVRVPSSSGTTNTSSASAVLGFRTNDDELGSRFYIGRSGSNLRFGISTDGDSKKWSSSNYSFNTTYLIVIRYDAVPGGGNDKMYMWVNPASLQGQPSTASANASITNGGGFGNDQFRYLELVQTVNGAEAHFDGFKASYGSGNTSTVNAAAAWADLSAAGAPLPVRFAGFEAKRTGANVNLAWKVEAEEDLADYQIERSVDGSRFETIGTVAAAGANNYGFADTKPVAGKSFYRIKAVDIDGKFMYSPIVVLNGTNQSVIFKVFPVPARNKITVQHSTITENANVIIASAEGRVVKTVVAAKGSMQTEIDLSAIPAGMYIIRFDNGNGDVQTMKFTKQ